MVLELADLQVLYALEFKLGHIVPVHVHEYVLNHYYAQFLLLPNLIHPLQQVFFTRIKQSFNDGL